MNPPRPDQRYPFSLISRRLNDVNNSCSHDNPVQLRKWPYNPAFMHPSDLARLGIGTGELVAIEVRAVEDSRRGGGGRDGSPGLRFDGA